MAEKIIVKKFRMTEKDYQNLKHLSEVSGLSQGEVIRTCISALKIERQRPSKELMDYLNKMNEIGRKINDITREANETGNVDTLSLKVYVSYLDKLTKEVRSKYY